MILHTLMAMESVAARKRWWKLGQVIGLAVGIILGWWAGAKLTSGPVPEPTTAPAPR